MLKNLYYSVLLLGVFVCVSAASYMEYLEYLKYGIM